MWSSSRVRPLWFYHVLNLSFAYFSDFYKVTDKEVGCLRNTNSLQHNTSAVCLKVRLYCMWNLLLLLYLTSLQKNSQSLPVRRSVWDCLDLDSFMQMYRHIQNMICLRNNVRLIINHFLASPLQTVCSPHSAVTFFTTHTQPQVGLTTFHLGAWKMSHYLKLNYATYS